MSKRSWNLIDKFYNAMTTIVLFKCWIHVNPKATQCHKKINVSGEFKCLQCGRCCHTVVPWKQEEVQALVDAGIIEWDEFEFEEDAVDDDGRPIKIFIERRHHQNRTYRYNVCRFLNKNKCDIYDLRPSVCRKWSTINGRIHGEPCGCVNFFYFNRQLELNRQSTQ